MRCIGLGHILPLARELLFKNHRHQTPKELDHDDSTPDQQRKTAARSAYCRYPIDAFKRESS